VNELVDRATKWFHECNGTNIGVDAIVTAITGSAVIDQSCFMVAGVCGW
jgi:hypothetical protein